MDGKGEPWRFGEITAVQVAADERPEWRGIVVILVSRFSYSHDSAIIFHRCVKYVLLKRGTIRKEAIHNCMA